MLMVQGVGMFWCSMHLHLEYSTLITNWNFMLIPSQRLAEGQPSKSAYYSSIIQKTNELE
jgi:hypothetical protein